MIKDNRDWKSTPTSHKSTGPSAYTDANRQQHDYYATEPKALDYPIFNRLRDRDSPQP